MSWMPYLTNMSLGVICVKIKGLKQARQGSKGFYRIKYIHRDEILVGIRDLYVCQNLHGIEQLLLTKNPARLIKTLPDL